MRRPLDNYETQPWQVDALVDHLPELSGSIWCPCVGDGSLLRRLHERRPGIGPAILNDINKTVTAHFHLDARLGESWDAMVEDVGEEPDWVIENPPFNCAIDIVEHAVRVARCGVVIMARVSFTEPTKARGLWLASHPYDRRITLERCSFTGTGKTDSATTDWLVWSRTPLSGPFGISAYGYRSGAVNALRREHGVQV